MQDATHGRDLTFSINGPNPVEYLVNGIGVAKDVVR